MNDGGMSNIDFSVFKTFHDENYFFFYIELNTEINLQDNNDLTIYLDTDQNANTGLEIHGLGAELSYSFGDRQGTAFLSGNTYSVGQSEIKLASAPTITSSVFEFCIKRDVDIMGFPIFSGNEIHVAIEDGSAGDFMPSQEGSIEYIAQDITLNPLPPYSISKQQSSDLRFLSYNVLFDGLFAPENFDAYHRIFNAIQPDIIGFQEIYNYSSQEVANRVETMISSGNGLGWYHAQVGNSDNHVVSKYPIINQFPISGSDAGAYLIDVPNVVEHLLFIVAHPPCCGNNEARQLEIDAIMAFVRDAKAGIGSLNLTTNSPIVIVGDMNLVGFNQQLTTFLSGDILNEDLYGMDFTPDWNGNDFVDAKPYTTGIPVNYTWYDEGSSFSPGRLDYNIFSGSLLNLENAYILFTPTLSNEILAENSLLSNDVTSVSDHLPVVCDFQVQLPNAIEELSEEDINLKIFPNPVQDDFFVSFDASLSETLVIEISDVLGKRKEILFTGKTKIGENIIPISLEDNATGTYLIFIKLDQKTLTKKIIKE